jgi:hypothetical protein
VGIRGRVKGGSKRVWLRVGGGLRTGIGGNVKVGNKEEGLMGGEKG